MKTFTIFLLAAMIGAASPALAGTLVYVPMGDANEVLVIDADQDRVIGRISGVDNSHGLAGTPDGGLLVAGSLTESDAGKGKLPVKPKIMPEDSHQVHHSASPGKADHGSESMSYLTVIRTSDGSVVRHVEVPGAVHHTAVTPDGRYAIAIHHTEGKVSVIDMKTFENVASIPTGPSPNYAVVSTDGNHVYVSNSGNDTVSEIDAKLWTVRRNFVTGKSPEHMALSKDGGSLYVNNADAGTVSVISLERGEAVKTYPIGGGLHGIDLSDDGKTLFVAGRGENKLVAVDLESGAVRSVPLSPSPYHLAAIHGAGKLYISSAGEDKIWVVNQKTLAIQGEIPIPDRAHQMVVVTK